jgi:Tol biopolymer transport system component
LRGGRGGVADAYLTDVSQPGSEQLLFRGISVNPTSWSNDGRYILYNESDTETGWDVRRFTFATNATEPFAQTTANELHGRFSPDGLWVAYASDESGRWEVYVRRADGRGERILLSTNGGFEPRWRRDGKEIFYITPDQRVMAVTVATSGSLQASTPQAMLTAQPDAIRTALAVPSGYRKTYTVTGDGQRFLVNVLAREQNTQTITALLNWPALLRRGSSR